jgi:hypothetical protein
MIRRALATALAALALRLLLPVVAEGDGLRIGAYSQQGNSEHAYAGGSINVSHRSSGSPPVHGAPESTSTAGNGQGVSGGNSAAPSSGAETGFPTISSTSPRLHNPHPYGPGSFWYAAEGGHQCAYVPASNGACFTVVTPEAGKPAQPPINPAAIAAELASRMSLQAGTVAVSPSARTAGLTGAASWFWLEPTPASQSLSLSTRGEHVTVTASVSNVQWSFGEGATLTGGPGVPYKPGTTPSTEAIRHVYQTRCLPGDRGRDPNVLAGCNSTGYQVRAAVSWGITYQATGPVPADGALPSRSTETSVSYPVSEARAFLTEAGNR